MKECILVGNAEHKKDLGSFIDSFEHVYRFNRFRTDGFEKTVGKRCTHWILNNALTTDGRNYYVRNIERLEKKYPELTQTITLTRSLSKEGRLKNIKNSYENYTYHICSGIRLSKTKHSTGTLAVHYLMNDYDVLNLVGFDFGKTNHYWGVESASDKPGKHNWNLEKEYVHNLVKEGKVKLW